MGRLRKSIIDTIIKLRKKGYTQAETAEKTGVNLKTVQKYDPLRKSETTTTIKPPERPHVDDLFVECVGDWIDSITKTLRFNLHTELTCPHCMGKLKLDEEGSFSCGHCQNWMPLPGWLFRDEIKAATPLEKELKGDNTVRTE